MAILRANKKRKTTSGVFTNFDKVFEYFAEYQQVLTRASLNLKRQERGERRKEQRNKESRIKNLS